MGYIVYNRATRDASPSTGGEPAASRYYDLPRAGVSRPHLISMRRLRARPTTVESQSLVGSSMMIMMKKIFWTGFCTRALNF